MANKPTGPDQPQDIVPMSSVLSADSGGNPADALEEPIGDGDEILDLGMLFGPARGVGLIFGPGMIIVLGGRRRPFLCPNGFPLCVERGACCGDEGRVDAERRQAEAKGAAGTQQPDASADSTLV